MDVLVLGAKSGLAVMLLVAGGAKLADLAAFAGTAALFVPRWIRGRARDSVALAAALTEIAVGALSLSAPGIGWANAAVFALTCVFFGVSLAGFLFYRGRSCRCFGALSRRTFDLASLLRSAVIAALAAVAMASVPPASIRIDAAELILLLAGAALLAGASFTAARALAASRDAQPGLAAR
jgi:hypothetical protein